ncbi:MAG: PrgI family protein [bacterium]|nr:PrgI family protein [bacterium]
MQFKVPQDVQREDTIIGPLTLRQMGILGVGGGIAYAIYVTLAAKFFIEVWLPPVAIISVITLAIAFLKIHTLPFWEFLMHFIEYHLQAKKRHWIQGSGYPFVSPFEHSGKKKKVEVVVEQKNTKNIVEITKVLDSHGEKNMK